MNLFQARICQSNRMLLGWYFRIKRYQVQMNNTRVMNRGFVSRQRNLNNYNTADISENDVTGESNERNIVYAVDFDGTLCANKYPMIGDPNMKLMKFLITQQEKGAKIILWSCREGAMLDNAIIYCNSFGLKFDAVNDNLPYLVEKYGNNSRKVFADVYIDDKSANRETFSIPFRR